MSEMSEGWIMFRWSLDKDVMRYCSDWVDGIRKIPWFEDWSICENDSKLFWQANNNPISTKIHAVCQGGNVLQSPFFQYTWCSLLNCFTLLHRISEISERKRALIFNTAFYYLKIFILFLYTSVYFNNLFNLVWSWKELDRILHWLPLSPTFNCTPRSTGSEFLSAWQTQVDQRTRLIENSAKRVHYGNDGGSIFHLSFWLCICPRRLCCRSSQIKPQI